MSLLLVFETFPSDAQAGIFRVNGINTVAADAQAPYVARPSTAMILIM